MPLFLFIGISLAVTVLGLSAGGCRHDFCAACDAAVIRKTCGTAHFY